MQPEFIHLTVHSEYSLIDGVSRIKPLVARCAELGMPAVAVTDQSNMFALVRFYKAAIAAGVKPIGGSDLWIRNPADANKPFRIRLLVQNSSGYNNLMRLISRSFIEGQHLGRAIVEREWLAEWNEGLIALSGAGESDVAQALLAGQPEQAEQLLQAWRELFPDRYYLELVRTHRPGEEPYIQAAVQLAARLEVPVVATNDVRFIDRDDFESHEVRVCIHDGRTLDDPRRPKLYSEEQYLKTPQEMRALFSDIPSALENSVEIARRCNLDLTLGKNFLPDFPVPEGQTIEEFLASSAREGLELRLQQIFADDEARLQRERAAYDERLEIELEVINSMGFPGYFLIVADFIQWAKDNQVPVGPGRGSGAGSLVAWVLKITDLDPLEHDLLFERFLNPERVSMPDFDVDFCMEGRDRVIDYVARRYGRDAVSQIITYGSMAAKAVVRDVGRVLGHPYGFVDRIAKLVPFEIGITLDKALDTSEELADLYNADEEVKMLMDMARKLEGLARNAGKHAGGVVIAPTRLTDFAPLYCEPGGDNLVTQYDKDDVEAVGLVKFDFLGLRTLTIIDWALKTVNRRRALTDQDPIDVATLPVDDVKSFELLKSACTTAIFQLESRGMKELIKKLQPDCFDDITALVALFRPGPLQSGMVDDFIERKHGRAEIVYPHPDLEPILKPTYGVILYQEQVMQIAQVLAGYSLGGADLLRRAMGKKKPEEMKKQGEIFRKGAVERGVDADTATYIFDLMEKFAGYGFNKSHSAAYALVSYQTLWLKAHYPAEFMAAVLSADMDNTDKVVTLIEECRDMGLKITSPDVNRSEFMFTVGEDNAIIYGLGAIKGVGQNAIEAILEARADKGHYHGLIDLCQRVDMRKVNRRVLESLIRAGALDCLGNNRATLINQLPVAIRIAEQQVAMQQAGQDDLFGVSESVTSGADTQTLPGELADWEEEVRLLAEKETLGLYLSGHPISRYEFELKQLVNGRIGSLDAGIENVRGRRSRQEKIVVAGMVVSVRQNQTQRGRMAAITLDDRTGRIEAVAFSQVWEAVREKVHPDKVIVVTGSLAFDEYRGGLSLRVDHILEFDEVRSLMATAMQIEVDEAELRKSDMPSRDFADSLREVLSAWTGGHCNTYLKFLGQQASGRLAFGEAWCVRPTETLLNQLAKVPGVSGVNLFYEKGGLLAKPMPDYRTMQNVPVDGVAVSG